MAFEKRYLDMMHQWLILEQEKKSIDRYLKRQGYGAVAVYGMAVYGRHVIRELQGSDIKVLYGIDQKEMEPYKDIRVLQPTDGMPCADAIINTVVHDHTDICAALSRITDCPVLSLEDIIYESYR